MIWLTIVVFVVLLLVLVLIHEWGHFIAAKKAGCRVEEFGFGFPPRVASFVWHDTRYSLNLLPIGGFVKIEGENMADVNPGPTSFASKSATWRIIILAAGVTMNVILAAVLLSIQAGIGTPTIATPENRAELSRLQTHIIDVTPNSPAANAGLQTYDRIVRLEDIATPTIEEVQVKSRAGQPLTLEIERQGMHQTLTITPRIDPPADEGPLGVSLVSTGLKQAPWWQAPWIGVKNTGLMLYTIVSQFSHIISNLIRSGTVPTEVTGPIGIAVYTNEVTKLGASYVLEFGALISLNLALINILPFPALDGGRILFVIIEKLRGGRRLPEKAEQLTHTIGFAFLILLMLLITFRDLKRFLP